MGTRYKALSLEERFTLSRLHEDGKAIRQIAAIMGRAASTVSRELRRNASAGMQRYKAVYADEQAWSRRWRGSRMARQPDLRTAVLNKLAMGWSPEQVAGRLAQQKDSMRISPESIYRFIYAQIRRSKDYAWRHYLPRAKFKRGYRGRRGGSSVLHIKDRVSIDRRPSFIGKRVQPGHWETDLMMFGNKKDNILVAQERASRFTWLVKQPDKKAARVAGHLNRRFAALPSGLRRTLTQDNGTEFAHHHELNATVGMQTYFCNPHSPWQKGGIENTNGRLRRWLPLQTNPKSFSQNDLQSLADRLNNTPRKCLGFKTPSEIFSAHLLHFKCESTFPHARE
jgi:IS30 family transposase